MNEVLASIAGKEQLPAEQVYKNIKLFKGMPAGRVLNIMNRGFSNSLGVSCSHCHIVGEYDREEKPTKQIARDMFAMVNTINGHVVISGDEGSYAEKDLVTKLAKSVRGVVDVDNNMAVKK